MRSSLWQRQSQGRGAAAVLLFLPLIVLLGLPALAHAQAADVSVPPVRWAEAAAGCEEGILNYDTASLLRYQVHRTDAKGSAVRQVLESKQGSVARLIQRNGQLLTPEEDAGERERLQAILDDPATYARHSRREEGSRAYAIELLHSLPKAMLWSYVPGQPQLPGAGKATVLDFIPDPKFKPPSLLTEGLTGLAGRAWIDAESRCVVRLQLNILHPVDFGWGGVLARVKEGGSVSFEQQKVGPHRWLYSRISEHVTIREVLVHTVQEDAEITVSAMQTLPAPITLQQAVKELLAMPVATR